MTSFAKGPPHKSTQVPATTWEGLKLVRSMHVEEGESNLSPFGQIGYELSGKKTIKFGTLRDDSEGMFRGDSEGDANRIPEDLDEDYFSINFKEYMLKEQLKWSRCALSLSGKYFGWVFWSKQDHEIEPSLSVDNCPDFNPNVCAIQKVRHNIRRALQKLISSPKLCGLLVQFWAATTTLEGRTKLKTQYQPFALAPTHDVFCRRQLCDYRMKMCREHNFFYADAESGEEQLGLLGRVFLHQFPESTPGVEYYSTKEYPQRELALSCRIGGSWAVPVFEHSSRTCVGVLEIVSLDKIFSYWLDESFLRRMHDSFKKFDLICVDGYKHREKQCRRDNTKACTTAFQELHTVLRAVWEIHELPLALTWFPCSACNDLLRGQHLPKGENFWEHKDLNIAELFHVSKYSHLRKKGIFERALSSPYLLYCSDITQLSVAEYPLVLYARQCNFSGWFTICLQSSYTKKKVYVVEIFLPTSNKDDENILTTLSLILGTMEENFKTFKLASGQQLGEILSVEVMDFRNGQKLPFVPKIQAPRLSPSPGLIKDRGLMLQLGQLDQPSTDAICSGMNVVSEEQNYIWSSLEALQNEETTMQPDSPHQPPLDPSNYGHNGITTEENITVVTSLQEGKRKTQRQNKGTGVRIEVSLDDIHKCAKMKRKEAAEKLKGKGESTFKRVCREHGIDRWPPHNIKTISQLPPSHVENQGQTLQLNSDLPSNQAITGVAHIKPRFQDANMVTIKAKYKNKTIKFELSFSSRFVEFEQEVAKRLHLEAGTYYAEYKDEEDELILIACDEDLQRCMHTPRSQGNTSIEVLLKLEEPLINLNPAN